MENFPSNSNETRAKSTDAREERHFDRVVETPVVRQKKPLGARLRETLFNGDNIVQYVVNEVLLPAFKDTMSDAVSTAVNRALFGESGDNRPRKTPSRSTAFGGGTHTNYSRYSTPPREAARSIPRRARIGTFESIIIASRVEAQIIMDQMHKAVEKYGMVSIRDLYEMVGEGFHTTDNDFGWTDLNTARIRQVRSGWMLVLPDPEPLE